MPPLTKDADGWFTVATDEQPSEATSTPPSPTVEKPRNGTSARSYGQLGSARPSTGPARKKDVAAARTPSGWIIAVSDIQTVDSASSSVNKRVDEACVEPSTSSSSDTEDATADGSIGTTGGEKSLKDRPLSVEEPLDDASTVPSIPEPTVDPVITVTDAITETSDCIASVEDNQSKNSVSTTTQAEKPVEYASTSTTPSPAPDTRIKETVTTSDRSASWTTTSDHSENSTDTTPSSAESTDTASITSTTSTAPSSSVVASADSSTSSTSDTPKKLRPRARSSPQPIPTLGIDPKLLVGKVLTHIRRSPDHPTVTLSFADGTTHQILVDGYDPRNSSTSKSDSGSSSRTCVLEMDEVLLRMLEVPGRHVVDRAITDCAHIRLADKAYERREWEHSWQQTHVAVAFKFAEESRWHCVWAMRSEYDDRGCIFRAFDDVYLQVLERQLPRTPGKSPGKKKAPPSPLRSPGKIDTSLYKPVPRPPPSPTATRGPRSPLKAPKKNGLKKNESWKNDT